MCQDLIPELADCSWVQILCQAEALTAIGAGDVIRQD